MAQEAPLHGRVLENAPAGQVRDERHEAPQHGGVHENAPAVQVRDDKQVRDEQLHGRVHKEATAVQVRDDVQVRDEQHKQPNSLSHCGARRNGRAEEWKGEAEECPAAPQPLSPETPEQNGYGAQAYSPAHDAEGL